MKSESVVVIGAGVIGLNVALVLCEKGYSQYITIIAEHLPGDTSINYTSPWAGANFSAISASDPNALRWDKIGYMYLLDLAAKDGKNAFVKETPSVEYWDELPAHEKIDSMVEYLKDFKQIATHDLPAGVAFGIEFTTITLNAPMHLRYLFQKLTQEYGVRVIRKKLSKVSSGYISTDTKVVFNCTGNAAKELPGVQDSKCFPTRGQILLAKAPHVQQNIMRHGKDYETYVIPRPYSNGKVILGGFMQKNVGTPDTFGEESESILTRTTALLPALNSSETEILGAFAGLRPSREGGARVARENVKVGASGRRGVVVHNYGAGGTGYQAGYGMAVEAVDTVIEEINALNTQSRL
ncbi:hypothetical protein DTO006G1_4628 [Penicillium roqueforti]|nr:hypothetical protein CBS147337_936 [Penicillium roqueforti]KAI2689205.1 hypothetical protein LCP963914a_2294 [Penicillium roqueforti]KAI2703740.1 hypothetical protein CBS147372_2209 [Penicillium roqueforti]KAI2760587.1 hypothetical protein DTO006G1_4628 [Penicillium roqueforti]KAI3106214.1 hypothetical protein CBS147333_6776 [Penicillium roqueforti]